MPMSLEDLLRDKKIEKVATSEKAVGDSLRLARRDMESARRNFSDGDYDWSLAIAYNAMLQAGKALMLFKGYRATGQYRHVAVVEFAHEAFGQELTDRLIDIFNRLRKKRHRAVYDEVGVVSREEAENAIRWAEEFVNKAAEIAAPEKKLH